ncbi:hypothetical protein FUA48_14075 [Flavobacterium alkalisoli]|uniref:Uncharacterized protein n=1 Tax=Flavobacterium alkalisoli TaxID=2602769 RepID=A0A5B9FUU0_9FLAO|nr:hypothetical protein [Flavobacterium alkalisoli]QEE50664.1 hypothetical protein FUA48_14075 [Flavobacterium alkalisoli]
MIEITAKTSLQSPHIYLQSAGSTGTDSTKGIHLRWMLKNGLSQHLPKGDYATPGINFNKTADFVNIYRAPYQNTGKLATVSFSAIPGTINDSSLYWAYAVSGKMFHVRFKNGSIYAQVRASVNPGQNPQGFIASYMGQGGILEVENQSELSFSVKVNLSNASQATIKTELLSVEENTLTAPRRATLRKTYDFTGINGKKLYSENIRSIRLQCTGTYPTSIDFELYSDLVSDRKITWTLLGKHALTLDDATAFERLEPAANIVNGRWLRYNDNALVNVNNYKLRWSGGSVPPDERIKNGVQRYIQLSDSASNPMAMETFSYDAVEGPGGTQEASEFEISNLQLLVMASLDYHIARMMGLGVLDFGGVVESGSRFIYIAEYVTFGDLQDGLGAREVHHLYCSLPTALTDQRLPVPVDLKAPVPGMYTGNMIESPASITDPDGYSHDGRTRYLSLFNEDLPDEQENAAFFYKNYEFISADLTNPVYAGIEYRKTGQPNWRKPELSNNSRYGNLDSTVSTTYEKRETVSIVIPDPGHALFVHREKESGSHDYSSYGINWFSRATSSSVIRTIESVIVPANDLLPPTNINTVLIQKENPLFLTSAMEQDKYDDIGQADKTLVRMTFEYDHAQELIDYQQKIGNELIEGYTEFPDNEELFAENIELFFRNRLPHTVSGKILSVTNHSNPLLVIIKTTPYELVSTGQEDPELENQVIIPSVPAGTANNFIGSVLVAGEFEYVVQAVNTASTYPEFTVYKRAISGAIINAQTTVVPDEDLESPEAGALFLVVENMQSTTSWNEPTLNNPSGFKINIDQTAVHRESIAIINSDNIAETHVQKFRGIYKNATVKKFMEEVNVADEGEEPVIELKHLGLYEVTFPSFQMPQHSQYTQGHDSVEFYNGTVRIHTLADAQGTRKVFKVVNAKNIGVSGADLTLYISDLSFPADETQQASYEGKIIPDGQSSISQMVNYYPGYKVYLYEDTTLGLTSANILPQGEDDLRYSVFGLRSHDNLYNYDSKLSTPVLMFAKAIREPEPPKQPEGGDYATRPDFFGKSTYTFTTDYKEGHKPYAVQFGRASDIQLLSAVYNRTPQGQQPSTVESIMKNIFLNGEEEFYVNRWNNFLSFNYPDGQFESFPDAQGIALPLPDSPDFIAAINAFIDNHNDFYTNEADVAHITTITSLNQVVIGSTPVHGQLIIRDFFKDTILNCFVPLTEIPIVFSHVKGTGYTPVPKKQKVRDRNGNLLSPTDPEFDMAPMMKVLQQNPYITQFTDFGLDGASNAKYFYAAKEMNMQMKSSDYSPILGPISMVNTSPAASPDVVKVISILENEALGITPAIEFTINAYPKTQHIKKINLYRTSNAADSLSVRTMQLVKTVDLTETMLLSQPQWVFRDDFDDLGYTPYGDPLFYRITVSRQVKYNDSTGALIIDYAPSEVSKVVMSNVVNNTLPESPVLQYYSEPISQGVLNSVILAWDRTVYNGKYHLYKMNSQGNWVKEDTIVTNAAEVYYPLGNHTVLDSEGNPVYHHYKVLAENFSGMISTKENILTIYSEDNWQDIGGIGDMIVGGTFLIR